MEEGSRLHDLLQRIGHFLEVGKGEAAAYSAAGELVQVRVVRRLDHAGVRCAQSRTSQCHLTCCWLPYITRQWAAADRQQAGYLNIRHLHQSFERFLVLGEPPPAAASRSSQPRYQRACSLPSAWLLPRPTTLRGSIKVWPTHEVGPTVVSSPLEVSGLAHIALYAPDQPIARCGGS